jgi:hypothetical protein
VFEGVHRHPIQLMIRNTDQRSKDYGDIAEKFRPGHADITYWQKYGIRDYRGGGRSSARETAARVAAGGVARAALASLAPEPEITGYMVQMGPHGIDRDRFDWGQIEQNPFWTPDAQAATDWADYLDTLRKSGDSVGAIIEVTARGVPAGLGAPVYGKLDTDLAAAMMSINAVKGVEIGDGMAAAALTGSANADEIAMGPDGPEYSSNHAGGILGGISTGQDVVVRFAVKADLLDPHAAQDDHQVRRTDRDRHQGPPRPLRRHPRRPGGRGDDGLRDPRPHPSASRACRGEEDGANRRRGVLGPYGGTGGAETVQSTFNIPEGTEVATFTFDMLAIDSWDNEELIVFVDGEPAASLSFQHSIDGVTGQWVSDNPNYTFQVTGTGPREHGGYDAGWTDQVASVQLEIANPGDTVTLGFGSTLNQEIGDESFAIDNVTLSAN